MIQFWEDIKEYVKLADSIDEKIKDKAKAIEDLQFELKLLKMAKADAVNDIIAADTIKLDAIGDARRSFSTIKEMESGGDRFISDEEKKKYGKMTSQRKGTLEFVRSSAFDDDVIEKYDPKLVDSIQFSKTEYSYSFVYEVGNMKIEFVIPVMYNEENGENGKFRTSYKDNDGNWNVIAESYYNDEVRKDTSEWVMRNCHQKFTLNGK